MPTIRDVASQAGVSVATVSRALNGQGRVSEDTRERVRGVASRLGYRPDELARHLVTRTTTTVAMVVPDITNPFFPELVDGVHRACQERGHALLFLQSSGDRVAAEDVIEQLGGRRLAGVVLVGGALPLDTVTHTLAPTPVVVVDRATRPHDAAAVVVRADHYAGARAAGEHLLTLGHRRIVHITGPAGLVVTHARASGLRDALTRADAELTADRVAEGDFGEASGYYAMRRLLAIHPDLTAVYSANDLMAIGAVRALDDAGRQVPGDVSVVGNDDIHLARYVRPALTTVRQPVAAVGRRAVARLLDPDPFANPEAGPPPGDTVLPVELVVRDSTGPVRSGRV